MKRCGMSDQEVKYYIKKLKLIKMLRKFDECERNQKILAK